MRAGYRAAIALAQDNLAQGLDVVTDAVNPLTLTRDAFAAAAARAGATLLEVELICSDQTEHRARIETRQATSPATNSQPGPKSPRANTNPGPGSTW